MIPKRRLVYRIDVYQDENPKPIDIIYCKPINIKYWLDRGVDVIGPFWTVNTLTVTQQKWAELFSVEPY